VFAFVCISPQIAESQTNPSYKYDFSSLYNPSEISIHPDVRVFVEDDENAIVFFRIPKDEIMANLPSRLDTSFNLVIKYVLRNMSDFEITDSGVNILKISTDFQTDYLDSYFRINLNSNTKNKLIVGFTGLKNIAGCRIILDVDNSGEYTGSRFLVEEKQIGFDISYNNLVRTGITYRISSRSLDKYTVKINYYSFKDYILVPPYYVIPNNEINQPDSVFDYVIGDTLVFNEKGFYVVQPTTNMPGVLCLLNDGESFPEIKTLSQMLEPLKLVSTSKELKLIKESENLKTAIDNFWLGKSNNQKFAREQIRFFYNRVELSNKLFSDYREGWKTDRGNLYVILGPPTIVNMSENGEDWFYGENPDVAGVLFIFDKENSIYGSPAYKLRRGAVYQTIWSQAIATWRDGRIFTITKN
jgi:GWxTD domain-containing protein